MSKRKVLPSEVVQFNGMSLICVVSGSESFLAVRPICTALEVDYHRQYKNLKNHPILGAVLSKQTTQVGESQPRDYVCLPERYVYGWLFGIRSSSEGLLKYQRQCYDVLYNYFHGALSSRRTILKERSQIEALIADCERELQDSKAFAQLKELKAKHSGLQKELKQNDNALVATQGQLFEEHPN